MKFQNMKDIRKSPRYTETKQQAGYLQRNEN